MQLHHVLREDAEVARGAAGIHVAVIDAHREAELLAIALHLARVESGDQEMLGRERLRPLRAAAELLRRDALQSGQRFGGAVRSDGGKTLVVALAASIGAQSESARTCVEIRAEDAFAQRGA